MNELFIWIPKTAGTSIATEKNLTVITKDYHLFDNQGGVTFGHADIKEVIKRGYISAEYWRNAYKFTVVRNPYSRFISLWKDFVKSRRTLASPEEFAQVLLHSSRKIGLYNAMDYSQCASQVDWITPDVEILYFEGFVKSVALHLNSGNVEDWRYFYNTNLYSMVNELYRDDFLMLGYDMQ